MLYTDIHCVPVATTPLLFEIYCPTPAELHLCLWLVCNWLRLTPSCIGIAVSQQSISWVHNRGKQPYVRHQLALHGAQITRGVPLLGRSECVIHDSRCIDCVDVVFMFIPLFSCNSCWSRSQQTWCLETKRKQCTTESCTQFQVGP